MTTYVSICFVLTFICLRRSYISYDLVHRLFTAQVLNVTPGPLTVTDTCDAVRKSKNVEYNKQHRLKRKLLLEATTSTETELAEKQKKVQYDKKKVNVYLPFLMMKVPNYLCLRRHIYISHVNKVQTIRVK
jgi:hypothetical protein